MVLLGQMLRCFGNIGFLAFARVIRHAIAVDKVTKRLVLRRHKSGIYNTTNHMSIQTLQRDVISQTNKQRTVVGGFLDQLFVLTIDAQQNGNKRVWLGRRFVFLRLQCSTPNSSNMFLSNRRNACIVELNLIKTKYISIAHLHHFTHRIQTDFDLIIFHHCQQFIETFQIVALIFFQERDRLYQQKKKNTDKKN